MKVFINLQTGEAYESKNIFGAIKYFKRDAKEWHYKLKLKNIVSLKSFLLTNQ